MSLSMDVAVAKGVGGGVNGATVWVPDCYGSTVLINDFASDGTLSTRKLPLASQSCNPNTLTVQNALLYVVCSGRFGGIDHILVCLLSCESLQRTQTTL